MSKKTSYNDEQMIHTLRKDGNSYGEIAKALDMPRPTVIAVLRREPIASLYPEIIGDGCSYLLPEGGASMPQSPEELLSPLDIEEMELSISDHPTGQLQGLDSGYPDIMYNERHKKYEVYMHGRRIWRDSKLTKACEVRLSRGNLSKHNTELLKAVTEASSELQSVLNELPI